MHVLKLYNLWFFLGESTEYSASTKRFRSSALSMQMLVYLCDEMAKRGDKDFFNALISLGILANVLKNRGEYFQDFSVTAREHDHKELAEIIEKCTR